MLPIIMSWAVTIHKTPGITLDKAVINLSHCFGHGMEYVSRLKTLSGLAISGLDIPRLLRNRLFISLLIFHKIALGPDYDY